MKRRSVFVLTATEQKVLKLIRKGFTRAQIAAQLGANSSQIRVAALDKERLLILVAQDKARPTSGSTLTQAKNKVGRAADPQLGRWKVGK